MKLYLPIRSKTQLQRLHQIVFVPPTRYNWAANALQVNKDSNQVIPLKLQGVVFTVSKKI